MGLEENLGIGLTAGAYVWTAHIAADTKKYEVDHKTEVELHKIDTDWKIAKKESDTQLAIVTKQVDAQVDMHAKEMALKEKELGLKGREIKLEETKEENKTEIAWAKLDKGFEMDMAELNLDKDKEANAHEEAMRDLDVQEKNGDMGGWFGYA